MWNELRFGLAALLMLLSLITLCTGVLGIFRFRDSLQRMHAAALNDTLGAFLALCSLMLAQGADFTCLKFVLVLAFLWISSPVSSHLIAQMEFRLRRENGEVKRP